MYVFFFLDFQNPGDNRDILSAGAVGPAFPRLSNETGSPTLSDSVFSEDLGDGAPTLPPRPIVDVGDSAPVLPPRIGVVNAPYNYDSNKLFVPIKKRRAPSPPGLDRSRGGASNLLATRVSQLANTQHRLVDKYVLDQRPVSAPESYHSSDHSMTLDTNILITPDAGARPKVSQASNLEFLNKNVDKSMNENSNFPVPQIEGQGDGEVNEVYREEAMRRVSNDSGVSSAQFLEPIPNDDIRPSEQQASNLDEAHFSAALSLFDPLTADTENSTDLLEGAGSPPPPAFHEVYPPNQSTNPPEPLICITNGGEAGQFKPVRTSEESAKFAFDIHSSNKTDQVGVAEDGSAVYLAAGVTAKKRRGSSDSSHSSSSNLSKEGIGMDKVESLEASQNAEDRVCCSVDN